MKTKLLIISLVFLAFISCKEENKEQSSFQTNLETLETESEKLQDKKGADNCFMEYRENLKELISEDEILKLSGFSKDKMTAELDDVLNSPSHAMYVYSFANGRVGVMDYYGKDVKYDTEDTFNFGEFQPVSQEIFMAHHRATTDEEREIANRIMGDEGSSGVRDEAKSSIMDEHMAANRRVEGIGELAIYNLLEQRLYVYSNGVMFTVWADISNDKKVNQENSIELAKMILAKCP